MRLATAPARLLATMLASALFAGLLFAPSALAGRAQTPSITWIAPRSGEVLNAISAGDGCEVRVRSHARVRSVAFKLDGRTISRRARAPYTCFAGIRATAAAAKSGSHRLTAVVTTVHRQVAKATVKITVRSSRQPSKPRKPSPPTIKAPTPPPTTTTTPAPLPVTTTTPTPPPTTTTTPPPPPTTTTAPTPPPSTTTTTAPAPPPPTTDPVPPPPPTDPTPPPTTTDQTPPPTTTDPTPPATPAAAWSADFSTGDFSQWSWWGQGQSYMWGHISVINPATDHIPPVDATSQTVAKMTVTAADAAAGKIHAKLYEGFGTYDRKGIEHVPADVSGTYSAWYYIPSSYQVPTGTWANIFQFKEEYDAGGSTGVVSDPLWWIQLSTGSWAKSFGGARWATAKPTSANQPVASLSYWNSDWSTHPVVFYTIPLDRWFEIKAVIHQGSKADYYIDGKLFDTALASQYPVSPFHANGQEWTFGVGNYATAPDTTLYLGKASYTQG